MSLRRFLIRFQLALASILLLGTFILMMVMVSRHNYRWDFTKEKIYSLSPSMVKLLQELKSQEIEILAFFPNDDPARQGFELLLKQCRLYHDRLKFNFYDPDRMPSLAKQYEVKEPYTVIVKAGNRQEKMLSHSEESLANALLRIAQPKTFQVCFVTGHGEAGIQVTAKEGISRLAMRLSENHYKASETLIKSAKIPEGCDVFVVSGPRHDFDPSEFQMLKTLFKAGKGILFLIDPMDPGVGQAFVDFFKSFGVTVGNDVIVDKMSRMAGGDFLVPLVSQYVTDFPITKNFDKPTFFPVSRGVHPSTVTPEGLEVVPLFLSGTGSWAETNLGLLEKGEAAFDSESDIPGPICLAVAVEGKPGKDKTDGRMAVVGDSDFITNTYFDVSGNSQLAISILKWLAKDDRFISIQPRSPEFKTLFLTQNQQTSLLFWSLGVLPAFFLIAGAFRVILRRYTK